MDTVASSSASAPSQAEPGVASTNEMVVIAPILSQADRVDKFLMNKTKLSRSALQRLFEQGLVLVNGAVCKKNYKVKSHDVFKITVPNEAHSKELHGVEVPLDIVYEDEHIAVINKEPGMAVHPGQGEDMDAKVTLVHALLHKYGKEGLSEGEDGGERPGIVHRLDKDTSGLMIICKQNDAHLKLKEIFQKRHVGLTKTYYALVLGKVAEKKGMIQTQLMRHPGAKQGHKMTVAPLGDPKGKEAITHYRVVKYWTLQKQSYTLLAVTIETGRTHQIRVHMSSSSHPIVGDALYATKHNNHQVPFLLLTSKELEFEHPISKEKLSFSVELPPHFAQFMEKLDQQQATFDKTQANQKKGKKLTTPYASNLEDLEI
jgi:23S rRNA pseudouridine1911/1915/1917 synthase